MNVFNKSDVTKKENLTGLTYEQVEQKKSLGQANVVIAKNAKSIKDILFSNFFNSLTFLIFIVSTIIIVIGKYEHLFFLVVSLANMLISVFQEIKAKKILDKVSLLMKTSAQVIRDGQKETVATSDLVLGDFLFLETGQQIAADAKVKTGVIEVNESLLTGESQLIVKKAGDFLYSGSYVVSGQSYAEIVSVGNNMYIETISQAAKKYKNPKTPLMQSLFAFIQIIIVFVSLFAVILIAFIIYKIPYAPDFITKQLQEQSWLGLCGMMIAMLPLGLFLLTNIILAVGFVRLANQRVYAQNLFGIEMLAQVNTLCLDKTGTITDGTMSVKDVILYYDKIFPFEKVMTSFLHAVPFSSHTHDALINRFNYSCEFYPTNECLPFSSMRKYSVVIFKDLGTFFLGAPEFILKNNFYLIQKDFEKQVKLGYRVLLLAKACDNAIVRINDIQQQLNDINCQPLALIVIEDTIKKDAKATIDFFQKNEVDIKVISGDNHLTVAQISQRVGILGFDKSISLEGLSDEEVMQKATQYNVFGRTSPQQKKILIRTLKQTGKKVAMTGDGVNDILALKEANLSIAMASGSQATRNISNLVLMDSNFASMPQVVFEGRRIINNLNKVSILFFAKTIIASLLSLAVICFNFLGKYCYYPLSPLRLQFVLDYWVIGVPSLFLSFEKNNKIIQGDFLLVNLKKALPYALLVFFSYCFIFIKKIFPLEADSYYNQSQLDSLTLISDFLILNATLILFTVLFRICQPFSCVKYILLIIMLSGFVISSWQLGVFGKTIFGDNLQIYLLIFSVVLALLFSWLSISIKKRSETLI